MRRSYGEFGPEGSVGVTGNDGRGDVAGMRVHPDASAGLSGKRDDRLFGDAIYIAEEKDILPSDDFVDAVEFAS